MQSAAEYFRNQQHDVSCYYQIFENALMGKALGAGEPFRTHLSTILKDIKGELSYEMGKLWCQNDCFLSDFGVNAQNPDIRSPLLPSQEEHEWGSNSSSVTLGREYSQYDSLIKTEALDNPLSPFPGEREEVSRLSSVGSHEDVLSVPEEQGGSGTSYSSTGISRSEKVRDTARSAFPSSGSSSSNTPKRRKFKIQKGQKSIPWKTRLIATILTVKPVPVFFFKV